MLCLLLFPARPPPRPHRVRRGRRRCGPRPTRTASAPRRARRSKVWHTLDDGELTEVYYPDIDTPALRDLQFVVSDGKTFAERERENASHAISARRQALADLPPGQHDAALQDRQDLRRPTRRATRWSSTSSSPRDRQEARALRARRPGALQRRRRRQRPQRAAARSSPATPRRRRRSSPHPAFTRTSSGYLGTSDGWTDLRSDFRMDWAYSSAPNGNVVQTGAHRARRRQAQADDARARLRRQRTRRARHRPRRAQRGFDRAADRYAAGWRRYLGSLKGRPQSRALARDHLRRVGDDARRPRGQDLSAAPTSPRRACPGSGARGSREPERRLPQGLVARPLPDRHRAARGRRPRRREPRGGLPVHRQQKPDGCFPQNSTVDGTEHWTNLQLDEVAFPIVLAWQLGRTRRRHLRARQGAPPTASSPTGRRPPQERWENQGGWSPATIASEIAGLVTAPPTSRAPTATRRPRRAGRRRRTSGSRRSTAGP